MKPETVLRALIFALCCPMLLVPWPAAAQVSTNWAFGPKTSLCIRMNYPDDIREPIREDEVYALMAGANQFFVENSYGAASLTTPTVTPVLLMPHPKAYYSGGFSVTEVWDVAARAGYYRTNYDLDCMFSVDTGLGRNSANPGTRSIYLIAPSVRSICHELGHVYGLSHANGWLARGGSIIGPGQEVGYGSPFDTMGGGSGHFNTCYKGHLEWLAQAYIQDLTTSGLYRLHAFDVPGLTNGFKYALRILRSDQLPEFQRYYWLELRQQPTNNPSIQGGPLLCWGPAGTPQVDQEVVLLDANPNYIFTYIDGFPDAALLPCHTFSDPRFGIHITPMARNGEWVDVRVNLGLFTNNHPPSVVLAPSTTNAAVGEAVTFAASAVDPDSDELVYAWDFGDGRSAANQASVTPSWPTNGEFVVRCAVSDMKGGAASAACVVRVGDPATFAITGHILAAGQPLEGVRVSISPTRSTLTSSDGSYALVGLANGRYSLVPAKAYYAFSPTSLNLVVSNQSPGEASFTATTNATPNYAPLVRFKSPVDGWTH
jgi:hypothetical protein